MTFCTTHNLPLKNSCLTWQEIVKVEANTFFYFWQIELINKDNISCETSNRTRNTTWTYSANNTAGSDHRWIGISVWIKLDHHYLHFRPSLFIGIQVITVIYAVIHSSSNYCFFFTTCAQSYLPLTTVILTPGKSCVLPPCISTTLCSWRLCPSPGMYATASWPLDRRTRAHLRLAELGFLGFLIMVFSTTALSCGCP